MLWSVIAHSGVKKHVFSCLEEEALKAFSVLETLDAIASVVGKVQVEHRMSDESDRDRMPALEASLANLTSEYECKCQEVNSLQAEISGMALEHQLQLQEVAQRHEEHLAQEMTNLQQQITARQINRRSEVDSVQREPVQKNDECIQQLERLHAQLGSILDDMLFLSQEIACEHHTRHSQGVLFRSEFDALIGASQDLQLAIEESAQDFDVLQAKCKTVEQQSCETQCHLDESCSSTEQFGPGWMAVELSLQMAFDEVSDHEEFGKQVIQDLVTATSTDKAAFKVTGLRAGSVIVDVQIFWHRSFGARTLSGVFHEIKAQSQDSSSLLRQVFGLSTFRCK